MTEVPSRIQRQRTKGWRMPPNTVYVGRPGPFGNPWIVRYEPGNGWVVLDPQWLPRPRRHYCSSQRVARRLAVWFHRRWAKIPFSQLGFHSDELRGKNLACWCPLDQPCHADILLRLANA